MTRASEPCSNAPPLVVVMAKAPRAGLSKTRLMHAGFDAGQAAAAGQAMLHCVLQRLARQFGDGLVLALSPDDAVDEFVRAEWSRGLPQMELVMAQGQGSLGVRMHRVWERLCHLDSQSSSESATGDKIQPIAFFGIDSPDVPLEVLEELRRFLVSPSKERMNEILIGPTLDGGYWMIAAHRFIPEVLDGVEWGTNRVFEQTCERAQRHRLTVRRLVTWYDVDTPHDLRSLVVRLRGATDPSLVVLHEKLTRLLKMGSSA